MNWIKRNKQIGNLSIRRAEGISTGYKLYITMQILDVMLRSNFQLYDYNS